MKRRTFTLGAILVGAAAVPFCRRFLQNLEDRAELIVRSLCDHFAPGHGDVPSAVSLGIDRQIVDQFQGTRRARLRLLLMASGLERVGFLERPADEQRAIIRDHLEHASHDDPPQQAETVEFVYRECVTRYFTNPDAWSAIRYRTPQPHGYPDYAECRAS